MNSSIFIGTLRHRRFHPRSHEFTYSLFMSFLDIDRLQELMNISPFSSYNRWNWASYHERDHFGDPGEALRKRVFTDAKQNNVELPSEGRIFLLTHLRYLGYTFNPVSFFYCYDAEEKLRAILAEVKNTFGETHSYWLSAINRLPGTDRLKYQFAKAFHVSPFMKMNQMYEWTFNSPSDQLINQCVTYENGERLFDSTLNMQRREWSRGQLHRTLAEYPWVTLKVIAAIHWEAVRLLWKRVPVISHPGAGLFRQATTRHWGASWKTR
jgi:uncharacterized protein